MYKAMYAVLAAALLVISGAIARQYYTADNALTLPFYSSLPNTTFEELFERRRAFVKMAHETGDPETYFSTVLPGLRAVSRHAQVMILRSPVRDVEQMRFERIVVGTEGLGGVITSVHETYNQRFGARNMADIAQKYRGAFEKEERNRPGEPAGPYWLRWYLISLLLAAMFFVVRIKEKGLALWVETLQPHQFLLAIAGWPLFMWRYPGDMTPSQQMRGALRYATLVLGTLLSGGLASAKAADSSCSTGKKQDPKRKWALVVRAIASRQVSDGPPSPEGGFRWHLVAPTGTFLEEASTFRKDFSSHTPIVGQMLWRQGPSTAAVIAGGTFASTGSRSAFAGTEVVITKPRWQVAMPLCLVERQTAPKPVTSFALLVQAVVKHGKWAAGPEVSLRVSPGRRPTWALGGVITYGWGKGKPTLENGLFRSNTGALRARTRLINAYSF